MTDALERAARAIWEWRRAYDVQAFLTYDELPDGILSDLRAEARAAILAFLDGQEDDVAEAIQDAADIDANSMTYARSVLRALRAAAGGEG